MKMVKSTPIPKFKFHLNNRIKPKYIQLRNNKKIIYLKIKIIKVK